MPPRSIYPSHSHTFSHPQPLHSAIHTFTPTTDHAISIHDLINQQPYDPQITSQLESYIALESKSQTPYDSEANRHLLKIYQITSIDVIQSDTIIRILLLTLTQLPSVDYLTSLYMLPPTVSTLLSNELSVIQKLYTSLENCVYKKFWLDYQSILSSTSTSSNNNVKNILQEMLPFFETSIRKFILTILQATYRIITIQQLKEYLNVYENPRIDSMIQEYSVSHGWHKTEDNQSIIFHSNVTINDSNKSGGGSIPSGVTQDITSVEYMARLLQNLA